MQGNLKYGQSELTALQQIAAQLHRLVGGRLHVQMREVKTDELSLNLGDAVAIRFMNRGQVPVLIDNQILLNAGEVYVEGDTAGPGINHSYKLEFQDANKNSTPLDTAEIPFVYPGAHVSVRSLHRKY